MLTQLFTDFQKLANPTKATILLRFFKTGEGEYGAGDQFLGLVVPQQRQLAKQYKDLPLSDIETLLHSKIHEHRMTALFILIIQFQSAIKQQNIKQQNQIFKFYLSNTQYINNRDLVDLSAPNIVGNYLFQTIITNEKTKSQQDPCKILYDLAHTKDLREKRIAIISTFAFIKNHLFDDTLAIAKILLKDKHDLIHKAVGRMLREVGKRCLEVEEEFLQIHYKTMPRTMLRYAIEKFPEEKRQQYLK